MRACLVDCRERVRKFLYGRAKRRVLVIGDSHVRVFEHWWFLLRVPRTHFDVVYVAGGTALGMGNRNSASKAYRTFVEALARQQYDLVLVNLGEVDTAYTLWRNAEKHGKDITELLSRAIDNYCAFLSEVQASHVVCVISACLPTLADHRLGGGDVAKSRQSVNASQQQRTALALEFNRRVALFCDAQRIPMLNSDEDALSRDGVVRPDWTNQDSHDHHYARLPYAKWLAAALGRLKTPADSATR